MQENWGCTLQMVGWAMSVVSYLPVKFQTL